MEAAYKIAPNHVQRPDIKNVVRPGRIRKVCVELACSSKGKDGGIDGKKTVIAPAKLAQLTSKRRVASRKFSEDQNRTLGHATRKIVGMKISKANPKNQAT